MRKLIPMLGSLLLVIAAPAHAHPGHDAAGGFGAGLLHPLLGLDHLMAMLVVGLWAAQLGGRALWAVPASFLLLMVGGAALAMQGIAVPQVEAGIVASLVTLGLLVAAAGRVPMVAAMALTGTFALFHGAAHGQELPTLANPLSYALGFAAVTAALHAAGAAAGLALARHPLPARLAGAATAATGVFLALA